MSSAAVTTAGKNYVFTATLVFLSALVPFVDSFSQADEPSLDTVGTGGPVEVVTVAPVTSVIASDNKYDNGNRVNLEWVPSIDARVPEGPVEGYRVYRITDGGEPELMGEVPPWVGFFADEKVDRESSYVYYVAAVSVDGTESESNRTASLTPQVEWIDLDRKYLLLIALIIGGAVIFFIETARRGRKLFVRKIAGLEAVDDAVGRATEMGRPILYVPGILDMDDVQTLAALTILGRVSRVIADYDTKIFAPTSRSLVMTAAREVIKASYMAAGRVDAYSDDMVNYVTDEQFGYVAAVDGIMVREKPATVFLLGAFFAESLILAETGNSIGAIQIAGTARPAQLPFFIAACDFTLIGEELFAASAYLSDDPKQLGSLKGQDIGKMIAMATIVIGTVAVTLGTTWGLESMQSVVSFLDEVFSIR